KNGSDDDLLRTKYQQILRQKYGIGVEQILSHEATAAVLNDRFPPNSRKSNSSSQGRDARTADNNTTLSDDDDADDHNEKLKKREISLVDLARNAATRTINALNPLLATTSPIINDSFHDVIDILVTNNTLNANTTYTIHPVQSCGLDARREFHSTLSYWFERLLELKVQLTERSDTQYAFDMPHFNRKYAAENMNNTEIETAPDNGSSRGTTKTVERSGDIRVLLSLCFGVSVRTRATWNDEYEKKRRIIKSCVICMNG
ncbi:hypothetical protein LTR66_017818, partial [Elasticomyces elasticus]